MKLIPKDVDVPSYWSCSDSDNNIAFTQAATKFLEDSYLIFDKENEVKLISSLNLLHGVILNFSNIAKNLDEGDTMFKDCLFNFVEEVAFSFEISKEIFDRLWEETF